MTAQGELRGPKRSGGGDWQEDVVEAEAHRARVLAADPVELAKLRGEQSAAVVVDHREVWVPLSTACGVCSLPLTRVWASTLDHATGRLWLALQPWRHDYGADADHPARPVFR